MFIYKYRVYWKMWPMLSLNKCTDQMNFYWIDWKTGDDNHARALALPVDRQRYKMHVWSLCVILKVAFDSSIVRVCYSCYRDRFDSMMVGIVSNNSSNIVRCVCQKNTILQKTLILWPKWLVTMVFNLYISYEILFCWCAWLKSAKGKCN